MNRKTVLRLALLLPALCGAWPLFSQGLYFSRFQPSGPGEPVRRVDLFNESQQARNLSGCLILTRHYVYRLPANTWIAPRGRLRLAWNASGSDWDLALNRLSEGGQRPSPSSEPGGYFLLLDPSLNWVDGAYFSQKGQAGFLPEEIVMPFPGRPALRLSAPDESDRRWSHIPDDGDPALVFLRIEGQWKPTPRSRNLLPATEYSGISARYSEGLVTLQWSTRFERDCYEHLVERSADGKTYREIARIPAGGPGAYTQFDPQVERNRVYYYRIVHVDKFGSRVESEAARARTEDAPGGFTFDVIRDEERSTLNVRFSCRENQEVRIELLDEELRKILTLFYGRADAEKQNLVSYNKPLPVGKYFVVVSAGARRYYEPLIIE
jgi:hypothetical protein